MLRVLQDEVVIAPNRARAFEPRLKPILAAAQKERKHFGTFFNKWLLISGKVFLFSRTREKQEEKKVVCFPPENGFCRFRLAGHRRHFGPVCRRLPPTFVIFQVGGLAQLTHLHLPKKILFLAVRQEAAFVAKRCHPRRHSSRQHRGHGEKLFDG